MTAVLSPMDPLRHDRIMSSLDDSDLSYSSTDWRAKYYEAEAMLSETRAELDDFHHTSRELEAELESELQRTEKAQQDLKIKVARAESERDDWKSKFMTLQTTHNTTTTSLQRELDKLRQEYQQIKIQMRDLEMGNDDLERNERAVSSSLADAEAKYSKALEEKILLEHELLDKANLEEETQRLKDELRDAYVEISILKDQLQSASKPGMNSVASLPIQHCAPSEDDLLRTQLPPAVDDLQLSELTAQPEPDTQTTPVTVKRSDRSHVNPALSTPTTSYLARSTTLPVLRQSPSLRPPTSTYADRPTPSRNISSATSASGSSTTPATTSKSKGVQMVSEMRARVRNLEQKIQTRVPRLRMGSVSGRSGSNALAASAMSPPPVPSQTNPSKAASSTRQPNVLHRRSSESHDRSDVQPRKPSGRDSSGWVLIMEDSPSPPKSKVADRAYSPPSRAGSSASPTLSAAKLSSLSQSTSLSGLRRPQSRLSGTSASTATTTSSITTPSSRPATPTFLPIPSSGLYAHSSTAGMTGLKHSVGPNGKRSSLGSATTTPSSDPSKQRQRPVTMPPPMKSISGNPHKNDSDKTLPQLPGGHGNVTLRSSKLPSSNSAFALSQSRIGRISSGGVSSGRRSVGDGDASFLAPSKIQVRARSGSSAANRS